MRHAAAVVGGDDDLLGLVGLLDLHAAGGLGDRGATLRGAGLEELDHTRQTLGDVVGRGHTTGVERPHRQLGAGLTDRLGGDDADRLADVHELAGRERTAVAGRADADGALTGEDRTHLDRLDAGTDQLLDQHVADEGRAALFVLEVMREAERRVDDLAREVPPMRGGGASCELLMFADDIAVAGSYSGHIGDKQLARLLPLFAKWFSRWRLLANAKKSQVVCFSRRRDRPTPRVDFLLGEKKLDLVESYRYLGLTYHRSLRWHAHFDTIATKARRSAHLIYRIIRPSGAPTVRAIRTLVNAFVLPVIGFGFPFWRPSTKEFDRLLSIVCSPLLRVLHLPHSTHRLSLLAECGIMDPITLWDKALMLHMRRSAHLPFLHPTATLIRSPPCGLLPHYRDRSHLQGVVGGRSSCEARCLASCVVACRDAPVAC